jgi:hypothetical protein
MSFRRQQHQISEPKMPAYPRNLYRFPDLVGEHFISSYPIKMDSRIA